MKKIKLIIAIIVAAVGMTVVFYACQKDGNNFYENTSDAELKASKDFNDKYIAKCIERTGIDFYELAKTPFFLEYVDQLSEFNAYFLEKVKANKEYMSEFDYWLNEFIQAPVWDEDEGNDITDEHHKFYIAAEKLSNIYFENNFSHVTVFNGVKYNVALDRIISIGDSYDIMEKEMINKFPHFVDLSDELQDLVRRIVIIMVTYENVCGCQSGETILKVSCRSQLESALNAAEDQFAKDYAKCRNKGKHSRCVHRAAAKHELARNTAFADYDDCIRNGGTDD